MAKRMINFLNDDGSTVAVETNAPEINQPPAPEPAERLRKVPAVVTERGLMVIRQALLLKRIFLEPAEDWIDRDDESDGRVLVMICADWVKAESARLSGKGGGDA